MQEIKKIGVLSLAKIIAVFGIVLGFVQGILMGQLSMQYAREGLTLTIGEALELIAMNPSSGVMPVFIALGWWSIIIAPILLGIGYFLAGLLVGWLFNVFTKYFGGLKIELSEKKQTKTKK